MEYKLEYHGVQSEQYFLGAGIFFGPDWHASLRWDACFTGIGDTPKAAAEDALEQAATAGHSVGDFDLGRYWSARMLAPANEHDRQLGDGEHHYATLFILEEKQHGTGNNAPHRDRR